MKVEMIIPIESLRGKLRQDGYYFRLYRGQQIVQRCPTKWKDTPARKAAREKFAARYASPTQPPHVGEEKRDGARKGSNVRHRQVNNPKPDPDAGLNPA